MNIKALMTIGAAKVRENTPLILTGAAVVGVVATTVLAVRAAPAAQEAVADAKNQHDYPTQIKHNPWEYATITWKVWLPVVGAGTATIAAIVLSHHTHNRQYAALMGLYVLGDKAFTEYREAVDEVSDDKTKEKVKTRAAEKAVGRDDEMLVNVANMGHETICVDMYSGRYFRSDMETIRRAENDFNSDMLNNRYGSLNEFYSKLGIESIGAGEDIGWNSDDIMEIGYNSVLTQSGQPALSIDFYSSMPKHNYYSN